MTDLIEVKTARLIGAPLDWAVAVATDAAEIAIGEHGVICVYDTPEGGCWTNLYQPSKDWSQGGLLIDEHRGSTQHRHGLPERSATAAGQREPAHGSMAPPPWSRSAAASSTTSSAIPSRCRRS